MTQRSLHERPARADQYRKLWALEEAMMAEDLIPPRSSLINIHTQREASAYLAELLRIRNDAHTEGSPEAS
jgi:hypothetical protein